VSEEGAGFREFGVGGDQVGQRRLRRSFRYAVAAIVAFAAALYVYDIAARHELRESQYISSLTLPAESARAILRNVVRREQESKGSPTPRYVEALAAIEEDEFALSRYQDALKLNPNDPWLLIKLGCKLFAQSPAPDDPAKHFVEARERFREAAVHPPRNVLPVYLEAAALAGSLAARTDLSEAVVLLARANNSGAPLLMPEPLWHASLPKRGATYADRRRALADRTLAPLYALKQILLTAAESDLQNGQPGDWDAWLEKLEILGAHLLQPPLTEGVTISSNQAMAGIKIQQDAIAYRVRFAELQGHDTTKFSARIEKLTQAMQALHEFERTRESAIASSRALVLRPLQLSLSGILVVFVAYVLLSLLGILFGMNRADLVLQHNRAGIAVLAGGLLMLAALLAAFLQRGTPGETIELITRTWPAALSALLLFGLAYPWTVLPSARAVLERHFPGDTATPELRRAAARERRTAYFTLIRRYYGTLLGGMIVVSCVWFLLFRTFHGVYPVQTEILVSGVEAAEYQAVRTAQSRATPPDA